MASNIDFNNSTITGSGRLEFVGNAISTVGAASDNASLALGVGSVAQENSSALGPSVSLTNRQAIGIGSGTQCQRFRGLAVQSTTSGVTGGDPLVIRGSTANDVRKTLALGGTATGFNNTSVGVDNDQGYRNGAGVGFGNTSKHSFGALSAENGCGANASGGAGVAIGIYASSSNTATVIGYAASSTFARTLAIGGFRQPLVSNSTAFAGIHVIEGTTSTTTTSPVTIHTFPLGTGQLAVVDWTVTERNNVSGDTILYSLKNDFAFNDSGTTSIDAGTVVVNNPSGATASTVALGSTSGSIVLEVTPASSDSRSWTSAMTLQGI